MAKNIEDYTSDEELARSHNYSDEFQFPSTALVDTIHHWNAQRLVAANAGFAERAASIVARAEFELTMRGESVPAMQEQLAASE